VPLSRSDEAAMGSPSKLDYMDSPAGEGQRDIGVNSIYQKPVLKAGHGMSTIFLIIF